MQQLTTNSSTDSALAMQMSALALSRQNLAISREQRDNEVTTRLQALEELVQDIMNVQQRLKADLAQARSQLVEQEIAFTAEIKALGGHKKTLHDSIPRLKEEITEEKKRNATYKNNLAVLKAKVARLRDGPGVHRAEDYLPYWGK